MAVNKTKITAQAQKYTAKGQFEKAIAEYKKILKADQSDIRTWLKMGDLYTRMGSRKEATETYLKVAEYYRKNDFHLKAVAVYRQVIKLDPSLLEVYKMLADAYLSLGLSSDALIQLEQLADMFQRAGNAEGMLKTLVRMAEVDPQNISTRLRIAEQYSKDGDSERAVESFSLACQQLMDQGRTDDYLKVAERLLYHDTGRGEVARDCAKLYLDKGEAKRALAKLQLCFAKDPRDVQTLELLAQAFQGLGQPDKAISVYTEIASILEERNERDERRRILQKILDLDPENASAKVNLSGGGAAAPVAPIDDDLPSPAGALSSSPSVVEETSEVVEDEAERADKLLNEAEVLLKYGLVDRAVEHIQKIFEFDYFNLDARERLKDVYMEAGREAEALEQLFVLAEGFIEEQPEGSVYFLHQILGADPVNRRAHEMLAQIGGVLPDGVAPLEDDATEAEEDPFGSDFGEAAVDLESPASAIEKFMPIGDDALGAADGDAEEQEIQLDMDQPTIEDIPYVVGENEFSEDDIDGADMETPDYAELLSAPEDSGIVDLEEVDMISGAGVEEDLIAADDGVIVGELPDLDEDLPELGEEIEEESIDDLLDVPVAPPAPPVPSKVPAPPVPSKAPAPPVPSKAPAPPVPSKAPAPPRPPQRPVVPTPTPPAPRPAAVAADAAPDISEELEEIEFFASQGLEDEARGILEGLIAEHPTHPKVVELQAQLMGGTPAHSESGLDLDALSEDLDLEAVTHDDVVNEIDEVFSQFKAGVEKQISQSDYATHYDLGVAYKEMGLLDDAVSEFEISAKDPTRAASSTTMIGMCQAGLGRFGDAIATFDGGLALPGLNEGERLALLYEKGKALEADGKSADALDIFNDILNTDPGFADVVDRIDALS